MFFGVYNVETFEAYYDEMHQDDLKIKYKLSDSIAFKARSETDIMYYQQEMKQLYKNKFREEMAK